MNTFNWTVSHIPLPPFWYKLIWFKGGGKKKEWKKKFFFLCLCIQESPSRCSNCHGCAIEKKNSTKKGKCNINLQSSLNAENGIGITSLASLKSTKKWIRRTWFTASINRYFLIKMRISFYIPFVIINFWVRAKYARAREQTPFLYLLKTQILDKGRKATAHKKSLSRWHKIQTKSCHCVQQQNYFFWL